MKVTVDGVELPPGARIVLTTGVGDERYPGIVSIRVPVNSPDRTIIQKLADGKPHVIVWLNDDGSKYAEAHAKLNLRLDVSQPSSDRISVDDILEVSGPAWGPPPNYSQFLVMQ